MRNCMRVTGVGRRRGAKLRADEQVLHGGADEQGERARTDHCPTGGVVGFKIMTASRGAGGHHLDHVALGERFIASRRSVPIVKRWDALMRRQPPPPLSDERGHCDAAGQVELKLETPGRDSTTHRVM